MTLKPVNTAFQWLSNTINEHKCKFYSVLTAKCGWQFSGLVIFTIWNLIK
jgi:hypothetical protein